MNLTAITLAAAALAPPGGAAAPPHAPNVCSGTLCLEVYPLPDPQTGKLAKPAVRIVEDDAGSQIELRFPGRGTVTLMDRWVNRPEDASAAAPAVLSFDTSCQPEGPCRRISASVVSEDGAAGQGLLCQVMHIWVMHPSGYRVVRDTVVLSYADRRMLRLDASGRCAAAKGIRADSRSGGKR